MAGVLTWGGIAKARGAQSASAPWNSSSSMQSRSHAVRTRGQGGRGAVLAAVLSVDQAARPQGGRLPGHAHRDQPQPQSAHVRHPAAPPGMQSAAACVPSARRAFAATVPQLPASSWWRHAGGQRSSVICSIERLWGVQLLQTMPALASTLLPPVNRPWNGSPPQHRASAAPSPPQHGPPLPPSAVACIVEGSNIMHMGWVLASQM